MRILLPSLLLVTGCIADESTPEPASPPDEAIAEPVQIPGELQLRSEDAPASAASAASCTYIQWCNKPNSPERIVCVLKPSCVDLCNTQQGRDSVVAACQNSAVAVCGTDASITYHGCNGLGPP